MADEKEREEEKVAHAVHIGMMIADLRRQINVLEEWDPEFFAEVEEDGLKAARFALGQVLLKLASY